MADWWAQWEQEAAGAPPPGANDVPAGANNPGQGPAEDPDDWMTPAEKAAKRRRKALDDEKLQSHQKWFEQEMAEKRAEAQRWAVSDAIVRGITKDEKGTKGTIMKLQELGKSSADNTVWNLCFRYGAKGGMQSLNIGVVFF